MDRHAEPETTAKSGGAAPPDLPDDPPFEPDSELITYLERAASSDAESYG